MHDSTHECPWPNCARRVQRSQLACNPHWYALPKSMRDAVWASYRSRGVGSAEHTDAVADALDWYHQQEQTDAETKAQLAAYLKRADKALGAEAALVVRDHYELHGTEDCDHDDCMTFGCDDEHRVLGEDDRWRQLAQDWHDVARMYDVDHSIGLFRHCPDPKCRRAAELLGDR